MPFALLIIGIALLVAGVKNTQGQIFALVAGDFTGPNNFIFWAVAILVIGAVGYVPKLKGLSVAFLTLVVVVLFLTKGKTDAAGGGFFNQITQALQTTTTAKPAAAETGTAAAPAVGNPQANPLAPFLQNLPPVTEFLQ